jgi:hypothetical protein
MRLLMSVFAIGVLVSSCRSATETAGCLAVQGQFDPRAPAFIIEYKTGTDPVATTAMLSAKYSFTAKQLYTAPLDLRRSFLPRPSRGSNASPQSC